MDVLDIQNQNLQGEVLWSCIEIQFFVFVVYLTLKTQFILMK